MRKIYEFKKKYFFIRVFVFSNAFCEEIVVKHKFKFDKLVRDKISQILKDKNIIVNEKKLDKQEFIESLKNKLIEEANEVKQSKNVEELKEELADVLEVFLAFLDIYEINFDEIEAIRENKAEERGGFEEKIYISSIEIDSNNSSLKYYLSKKEQYPEIIK